MYVKMVNDYAMPEISWSTKNTLNFNYICFLRFL